MGILQMAGFNKGRRSLAGAAKLGLPHIGELRRRFDLLAA